MKRIVIFFLLFSFFAVSGCSNEDENQNNIIKAREVAWNSISAEQQTTAVTNWE